jgi:hypothetical protein
MVIFCNYILCGICPFYLAGSTFYFKGEPGFPGAAGQSGLPGPKVSTNEAKQNHSSHGFQVIIGSTTSLYPTVYTECKFLSVV